MFKLACPACGAELLFKSSAAVFSVCSYCSCTVVRHDMDLENLGKMAQLPGDMSPLQIGTKGVYNDIGFELVGRLKVGWANGSWDEWYAIFDDGHEGWLAHAQGFFMVSFQSDAVKQLPDRASIKAGDRVYIDGYGQFNVDDVKQAHCIASEGQLPMAAVQGRESISVDLSGPNDHFACIDYAVGDVRLYLGHYLSPKQLQLTSLRQVDGW